MPADLQELAFDVVVVTSRRTGAITYWNRAASDVFGWPAHQAIGQPAQQLLRTRYPVPFERIEERVAQYGHWEGNLTQVARAGQQLVLRSRLAIGRLAPGDDESVVQVATDITHRVETEQRLRASEDSFRLLVARVVDYAIFMLDTSGHIVTWNEGAQRIKGYTEAEILGRHFSVFYPRADVEAGKPRRALAIAEREGRFEDEGWRVRKDGTRFWANVMITALRDETGRLRGFGKVTRDITERKLAEERRAEEQRREAANLREHAERMVRLEKAKGDFLNLASHELRGPLAVLKGYVSMFQDHTMAADELPDVLPVLTMKVQEMEVLVQQMLETARLDEDRLLLRPETFDLREAAERVIEHMRPVAGTRHELTLATPASPVLTRADLGRIETAITNLIDNAIKYSPAGGPVRCAVAEEDGRATFTVEDAGIGIEPDALQRLFTRFGRIETPETAHISGTGLGLYLSREIARRHGGDIRATSRPGRGSRFTLVLPTI